MSYILDALKKADAERARGAVPDLHAQPGGSMRADRPRSTRVIVLVVALNLVALALLAWWLRTGMNTAVPGKPGAEPRAAAAVVAGGSGPARPAPGGGALPAASSQAAGGSAGVTVAGPRAPEGGAAAAAAASSAVAGGAGTRPAGIAPAAGGERPAAQAGTGDERGRSSAVASGPAASAMLVPAPAGRPASVRIYTLAELPDDVRRELPALTLNGAMHAQQRAERLLMVNGRLLHEGDEVAPGVLIDEIGPRAAIFAYRDYRFRISW